MKNPKALTRLEPTAVRGKWFEVNDHNHLAKDVPYICACIECIEMHVFRWKYVSVLFDDKVINEMRPVISLLCKSKDKMDKICYDYLTSRFVYSFTNSFSHVQQIYLIQEKNRHFYLIMK